MKRRVLIVDQNKAIRFLLQTSFGKTYQVINAAGCFPAMDWLSEKLLPDLIVVSSTLPDIPDWELVEYLSSSMRYGSVPLIVLSDDSKENTAYKCHTLGITHFFQKPFNPLELVQLANRLTMPEKIY